MARASAQSAALAIRWVERHWAGRGRAEWIAEMRAAFDRGDFQRAEDLAECARDWCEQMENP